MKTISWVIATLTIALSELAFALERPTCVNCSTDSNHVESPLGIEENPLNTHSLKTLLEHQKTPLAPSSLTTLSVIETPLIQLEGFGTFQEHQTKNGPDQNSIPFNLDPYKILDLYGDEHP